LLHDDVFRNRLSTGFLGIACGLTLFLFLAAVACGREVDENCLLDQSPSFSPIILTTEDNIALCGRLYGSAGRAVVLAHGWSEDQSDWAETAESLSSQGYLVLTFSFRGHGLSAGEQESVKLVMDLDAALSYLLSQGIQEWFLIGSGTGGTAAIHAATNDNSLGMILLSASTEVEGIKALGKIPAVKVPKLLIVAEKDIGAHNSSVAYFDAAVAPRILEVFSGDDHGTALLTGVHSGLVNRRISDFLEAYRR